MFIVLAFSDSSSPWAGKVTKAFLQVAQISGCPITNHMVDLVVSTQSCCPPRLLDGHCRGAKTLCRCPICHQAFSAGLRVSVDSAFAVLPILFLIVSLLILMLVLFLIWPVGAPPGWLLCSAGKQLAVLLYLAVSQRLGWGRPWPCGHGGSLQLQGLPAHPS